jgi:hypothetical protein
MASTAMRLVILTVYADTFYVLIGGRHLKLRLP